MCFSICFSIVSSVEVLIAFRLIPFAPYRAHRVARKERILPIRNMYSLREQKMNLNTVNVNSVKCAAYY